jgi:hypothetical protein
LNRSGTSGQSGQRGLAVMREGMRALLKALKETEV